MTKIMVYKKFYRGESIQSYIQKLEMGFEAFLILNSKTPAEKNKYQNEFLQNTERVEIH